MVMMGKHTYTHPHSHSTHQHTNVVCDHKFSVRGFYDLCEILSSCHFMIFEKISHTNSYFSFPVIYYIDSTAMVIGKGQWIFHVLMATSCIVFLSLSVEPWQSFSLAQPWMGELRMEHSHTGTRMYINWTSVFGEILQCLACIRNEWSSICVKSLNRNKEHCVCKCMT